MNKRSYACLVVASIAVVATAVLLRHPCGWAPNPPAPDDAPSVEPGSADETGIDVADSTG